VRNEVILPSKENYNLYTRKRLLKEKWNVYKYSICCDKQAVAAVEGGSGARILGWITGFERYSLPEDDENKFRHIWKYNWEPVEVWLKDEVYNLEELDSGNTYDVVAKNGPFAVIRIPQAEGITLDAWNLNELNNDTNIVNPDNPLFGDYLGPGLSIQGLGSGVADNAEQFPDSFFAKNHYVPVGGHITRSSDSGDLPGQGYLTCNLRTVGQLVELFEIPTNLSILGKTGPDNQTPPSEKIYVFNVENAVDESCLPCLLETEIVGI
jgi:hypothetical protein